MEDTLYIIGNGFDLYHGIQSSYYDYMKYISMYYPDLYEVIVKYLIEKERDWWRFEQKLGELNINSITSIFYDEIVEQESELFNDTTYDNDYFNFLFHKINDEVIDDLFSDLEFINIEIENSFCNWIKKLKVKSKNYSFLEIDSKALFLNFNYTASLKEIYSINDERILHIHGTYNNPIYGHNLKNPISYNGEISGLIHDIEDQISYHFDSNKKDVRSIIEKNNSFFCSLGEINSVHIIGHSLNDIDLPYFEEISNHLKDDARWYVTFYNKDDYDHHLNQLSAIGLLPINITIIHIDNYNSLFSLARAVL